MRAGGMSPPQGGRGQVRRAGVVLGVGPFADGGNMAIFKTREAAEAFSREDPFILEGLLKSFVIKDWRDSMLPE
jgi:uncharacterized protein YciI